MPDDPDEAPRLEARTFGWAAACAAATVPLIVLVVFRGDLGGPIVSDREAEEVLWIVGHLQQTFHQIHQERGLLAALRFALLDGYPYFGNVLHFWVLSIPLRALLPYPLWFNVNALVVDALNAFGAAVLAIALTRSRAAGLLAAVAMALNPYTLMVLQRGRHRDAIFLFVGLFLAALVKAAATDRNRDHAICALWLAVSGISYWFHALFGAMCAALWALTRALSPRGLAIVVGLAVLVSLPFAAPFYGQGQSSWRHYPWLTPLPSYAEVMQLPPGSSWHGIDDQSLRILQEDGMSAEWLVGGQRARGAQPAALLLLAFAGAWVVVRRAPAATRRLGLAWIATVLVFYVIGLGVNLHLQGHLYPLEMPYRWLFASVPFLSRLYHPHYASLFTLYGLLALASLALSAAPTRRIRLAVCGLAGLSILGSAAMAPPLVRQPVEIPAFYATLSGRAPGALVELPCYRNEGRQPGRSFYETLHDRRIIGPLGGYGHEVPLDPALTPTRVLLATDASHLPSPRELDDMVAAWRAAGARWVVLHEVGNPGAWYLLTAALTARLGPPVHEERERLPFAPEDTPPDLLRVWDLAP